ncbi:MAG: helicase HerA-like domain-containing protein [Marinifilaceae bacterium]
MRNKATYLGTVEDVKGASVRILLSNESLSGLVYVDGQGYRIGQIGTFIKIPIGFTMLYGIISQVGANSVPDSLVDYSPYGNRWMTVQLVGEGTIKGDFQRGISQYPTIGDEAHLVSEKDLGRIYGKISDVNYINIGNIVGAESIPALLDIDKLVTRHCSIVGSTGSGKSNTVVALLKSINSGKYPKAKIVLIDPHSEYRTALGTCSKVYSIDGINPLKIPYWCLSYNELALILFDRRQAADSPQDLRIQQEIFKQKLSVINSLKSGEISRNQITVDSPIPFDLKQVWYDLYLETYATVNKKGDFSTIAYQKDKNGNSLIGNKETLELPQFLSPGVGGAAPFIYTTNKLLASYLNKLRGKLLDNRIDFIFNTSDYDGITKDLDDLLDEWINHTKPITILDLGGIPFDIMDLAVGLISRLIFETMFWGRDIDGIGRQRPVLMVYEEAHSYLPKGGSNQFVQGYSSSAVRRICKEGRKYGIGALIVSQRPSDLDTSILSQCGTFITLRLSSSDDQSIIRSSIPDNSSNLSETLSSLRTGEAIIVGEAIKIPSRVIIPLMKPRPDSHDATPSKEWSNINVEKPAFADAITNWRKQKI